LIGKPRSERLGEKSIIKLSGAYMSYCQNWIEVAVAVWGLPIAAFCVGFVIAGVTQSVRGKTPLVPVLMVLLIVCAVGAVAFSILKPIGFLPTKVVD
jgi:hypothetical protein